MQLLRNTFFIFFLMKILIADDDPDDRTLASTALKEINFMLDVDFVCDGVELIQTLNNSVKNSHRLPDLVLLDLNMPRKDGRTALKEIKADPKLKHLDIIIFSTSTAEDDKNYTLSMGAKKYIVKPSDYNELINVFKNINEQLAV